MGITKSNLFTVEQNSLAQQAKCLAHPARIAILEHLLSTNACINGDLVQELGLAQATVSQHLKELKSVGLIQGNIEGSSMSYCIDPDGWKSFEDAFAGLFSRFNGTCC